MRIGVLVFAALCAGTAAQAADVMRFWNLTSTTITGLSLAPAGTPSFGPNQCANDADGAVDHDERLRLVGLSPGRYDVRVTQKGGRVCLAPNVEVKAGGRYAFSLTDQELTQCHPE